MINVTLRNGDVVLGKLYQGKPSAVTYANRTQAERSAAKVSGDVIQRGRPFYVRLAKSTVAPWRPFEVKSYRTINKPDGGSYEAAFIRYTDGMEPKVAYIPSNELDKA